MQSWLTFSSKQQSKAELLIRQQRGYNLVDNLYQLKPATYVLFFLLPHCSMFVKQRKRITVIILCYLNGRAAAFFTQQYLQSIQVLPVFSKVQPHLLPVQRPRHCPAITVTNSWIKNRLDIAYNAITLPAVLH